MALTEPFTIPPLTWQGPLPKWLADKAVAKIGAGGPPDPAKDPLAAYRYLDAKRQATIAAYHQRPLLRLWDGDMKYIGTLANERSVKVEELMADTGSAGLVIRKDNWLSNFLLYDRRAEQDLHLTVDPIPTQQDWPYRWGGKITSVNAKRSSEGLHTVEMQAAHNREHLKHWLAIANPVLPPELQIPKMWMLPFNCRTALTVSLTLNIARDTEPLLAIPDNMLNPAAWLGLDVASIWPLAWPIQPQFLNPVFDQSRFEVFAARATDFHTASAPILQDSGCIWRSYTYLKTDLTSPHPELAKIGDFFGINSLLKDLVHNVENDIIDAFPAPLRKIISGVTTATNPLTTAVHDKVTQVLQALTRPTRNAIILACEDKSDVHGLTGTALDGPISFIASTADDLITDILIPQYDPNGDGVTDPLIAKWFGAAPRKPLVTFRDGDYSAIVESNRIQHASTASSYWIGGHSPGWVNDLISFGIKYGLAQLSDVIQYVAVGGLAAYQGALQMPGTPGLDELYQGELSDTVMAYQRASDPVLEMYAGDMRFRESYNAASQTAWVVSGALGLRDEQWKNRSYTSFNTTLRIFGSQYLPFLDYNLGDRVNWEMANTVYTDQVAALRYGWDENTPVNWEVAVGTDNNEVDPVSKALRGLAGVWNLFGMAMGSTELF